MTPELQINNVWMKVNTGLAQEIVDFWQSNNMLNPQVDPVERALQVVLTIRHQNKIVGLTSTDLIRFQQLNNNIFYLFRMAVLQPYQVPGIGSKAIVETREILEAYATGQTTNKAIGMLTFVENPELIAKRNEAVWPASKMVYIGNDKQGRHIRVCYFKGVKI
jgi:hypothetical protein